MPYTDINGARLYYEIAGEGETVTLLHAGIADRRMWDAQFDVLAQHYRVLRYDLRGFGQTEAPTMSFAHHEDLAALLDALGIKRTTLIGCSNGGRVAMNFTLAYPDRASALVMVCSSPGGFKYQGEAPALWPEIVKAFESGDLEHTAALEMQLWAVGPYRTPEQVDAAIRELVTEMDLIALKKEDSIEEEMSMTPPTVERLGEIHIPVLIVVGDVDSPVTLAAGTFMEQEIAGAHQVVMTNSAHLPNMEHPDEFNHVVLEFLAKS